MRVLKVLLLSLASILIIGGVTFYLIGKNAPQPAGINIETTPSASVFINGSFVGETPYVGSYKAGTIMLRLVPQGSSENLIPYETQIKLTSGTETVVSRDFLPKETESRGYVISLEKIKKGTTELVITSDPTGSQVAIDGVPKGFSPYSVPAITPAEHLVEVKTIGYKSFSKAIKTVVGYRLTIYVKLGEGAETENIKPVQIKSGKKVTILGNSIGYVDVKSEPGELGTTVARVNSGEVFDYIDTDVATDWVEINLNVTGDTENYGWIPKKFASVSAEIN